MTPTRWTRETVIEAAQQWARDHDGYAPKMRDWDRSTPSHPHAQSVLVWFGSWNAMLDAADLESRRLGGQRTAEDTHRTRYEILRKQHRTTDGSVTATFGLGDERIVEVFYPEQVKGRRGEMSGSLMEATRMAADYCRALGPEWRIHSLSTPMSILSDLNGRAHKAARASGLRGYANPDSLPAAPELAMLRGDDAHLFVQRPA